MEIQISTSGMEALRKLQRNLAGSSDHARVNCILMLGMGSTPSYVASCLGIGVSTVYRYRSAYFHVGTDELLENRRKGYWGILDSHQLAALRKELREHTYTDEAKSVAAWIKYTFGVEYTPQGVADLLNLKFLRKTFISTGFYRTKGKFRQSIKDFFDDIGDYKEELMLFLTFNFSLSDS